ncbi:MAG: sulfotransferase family protein [Nanoarchaeota archaeon]
MLPNFLIVGALRSGTTSLYNTLADHSSVYFPDLKEPRFFSSFTQKAKNGPGDRMIPFIESWETYKSLYKDTGAVKAVGDASVENLYLHNKVIPYIHKYLGDVKIIILLRNPYERAISAYKYLLMKGRELFTFKEALEKEKYRINNHYLPIWYYKSNGYYYNQIKSYQDSFSSVKIILFEDLLFEPQKTFSSILKFLEIDDMSDQNIFKIKNASGGNNIIYHFHAKSFLRYMNKTLSPKLRPYFLKLMNELINNYQDINLKQYLNGCYNEDIIKLEKLINRDLRNWLE